MITSAIYRTIFWSRLTVPVWPWVWRRAHHCSITGCWNWPGLCRREYLFDGNTGKRVLRDLLTHYVPRSLIDRPKRGFSVPIKEWLVGPLRDWAEDLMSEQTLREQGIFDVTSIRDAWHQHLYGWANHSELMWSVLMFQAWWKAQAVEL